MQQANPVSSAPQPDIHAHRVLILDFGSQYTQLIARRVRECGVYSEIYPWDLDEAAIRAFDPAGVVLSGGPESVNLDDPPRVSQASFRLPLRQLGGSHAAMAGCSFAARGQIDDIGRHKNEI